VGRGDAAWAVPRRLRRLAEWDRELGGSASVCGWARNAGRLRPGAAAWAEAHASCVTTRPAVQPFDAFADAAESWPQERHRVLKATVAEPGAHPRFVVTALEEGAPALLSPADGERGQGENLLQDCKNALPADRLSCGTFAAPFLRLREHAAAYVLRHALRTQVAPRAPRWGRAQCDTRRLQGLKVAALGSYSTRRLLGRRPPACPLAPLCRRLATTLATPPGLSAA